MMYTHEIVPFFIYSFPWGRRKQAPHTADVIPSKAVVCSKPSTTKWDKVSIAAYNVFKKRQIWNTLPNYYLIWWLSAQKKTDNNHLFILCTLNYLSHVLTTVHRKSELNFWIYSKFKVWAFFSNPSTIHYYYTY